jgi:hypothetical protein
MGATQSAGDALSLLLLFRGADQARQCALSQPHHLADLSRAVGHVFGPRDQFGRRKVENDRTGRKFASSIGGSERGDRVIIDDPNDVKKAESKAVLDSTILWLTEVMPDRLNDQRQSAIILIQQRTNERDCSGTLPSLEADYVHLSVPMAEDRNIAAAQGQTPAIGDVRRRCISSRLRWPSEEEDRSLPRRVDRRAFGGRRRRGNLDARWQEPEVPGDALQRGNPAAKWLQHTDVGSLAHKAEPTKANGD